MKLRLDKKTDALYLRLKDSAVVESEEVQPGVIVDFDVVGQPVGLEILSLSKRKELEIAFGASPESDPIVRGASGPKVDVVRLVPAHGAGKASKKAAHVASGRSARRSPALPPEDDRKRGT